MVHALVIIAVEVNLLIPPDLIDLKLQIQVVSLKSTELGSYTPSALGLMNIEHVLRIEINIKVGFSQARYWRERLVFSILFSSL